MKKIGLIADIHANLEALQRALEILDQQQSDQIICAGDVVEKGSAGDAVVALLRTANIACVMGNQAWLRANADLSHPATQGRLLSDETLSYLASLPKSIVFTWEERRVVMTHGAPWSTNEYIFPNSSVQIFQQIANEAQADVVVLGHTHTPMCIRINTTRIINPGAVSGNYLDGKGTCAVLTLPDCLFQVYSLTSGELLQQL
jgi:putative phosphoesterase